MQHRLCRRPKRTGGGPLPATKEKEGAKKNASLRSDREGLGEGGGSFVRKEDQTVRLLVPPPPLYRTGFQSDPFTKPTGTVYLYTMLRSYN